LPASFAKLLFSRRFLSGRILISKGRKTQEAHWDCGWSAEVADEGYPRETTAEGLAAGKASSAHVGKKQQRKGQEKKQGQDANGNHGGTPEGGEEPEEHERAASASRKIF